MVEEVGVKRKPQETAIVASKKQKLNNELVTRSANETNSLIPAGIRRTSNLEAPIMQLFGHSV